MFEKIFVTQDYLIASKIADYFSYPIDVPIPVRTMNPEGELLLLCSVNT